MVRKSGKAGIVLQNLENHGIYIYIYLLTGARFLPSTV